MLDLALSILFSSLIFVIFKLFSVYKIQTHYAIIINYVIASSVGLCFYEGNVTFHELPQKRWFWGAFALGLLFIVVFNLMARTSQKLGVSVASVATKMSLVLPVLFGVLIYREHLGYIKITGIILALIAVYFASIKKQSVAVKSSMLVLPILVFIGSGTIDTSLAYFQKEFVAPKELSLFSAFVFASAACLGIVSMLVQSIKTKPKLNPRNIAGGIALGIPNYFSIYFLLRALQNDTLTNATIFTINNVSIVMFSTLLGIILFKEQISQKNWIGIAIAIISIVLVAI